MSLPVLPLILTSVAAAIAGQVTFKLAMNRFTDAARAGRSRWRAAATPLAFGFAAYGVSTVCWLWTLSRVELSFAFPFVSLSHIGILTLARFTLGERLTAPRLTGAALILAGVLLVTTSA